MDAPKSVHHSHLTHCLHMHWRTSINSLIPGNFRVKHTELYSTSNSPQKCLLDTTLTSRHFNTENMLSSQLGFLLLSFMSVGQRRHVLFLLLCDSLCSVILSAVTLSSLRSRFLSLHQSYLEKQNQLSVHVYACACTDAFRCTHH